MPEKDFYLTAAAIGNILGLSSRTIQRYREEGEIGNNPQGFPLIEAVQHYIKLLKEKLNRKEEQLKTANELESELVVRNLKVEKLKAEVREKNAVADIKELERDKLKGSLVIADEVLAYYSDLVIKAKAKFLSLPDKLALELSGMSDQAEIQELLQQRIDECLLELSSTTIEVKQVAIEGDS